MSARLPALNTKQPEDVEDELHKEKTSLVPKSPVSAKPRSVSPVKAEDFVVATTDLELVTIPGEETFDPKKRSFTRDELRPQPMIKKSKKVFVPEDLKDEKYWARRNKNNVAAKRSRDARRIKENQIAMRASFLEVQNNKLQDELEAAIKENNELKERLKKYEPESFS